ncbi:MAG: sensor domain-containing diguanylate cyclase [Candidatus Krumholzibacteriota bacterium]|nr:sensor domain-containing diguanylate cyclase [Candidatus Krumholzibacteriota bacterium]
MIFNKIISSAIDILPTNKIHMIFIEGQRIIKYTGEMKGKKYTVGIEDIPGSSGITMWLHRELEESKSGSSIFNLDLSLVARELVKDENHFSTVISAPLMSRNALFGVILAINDPEQGDFSEEDIHLLNVMANQGAIAFENYLLYKKLKLESITDGLTGIYNYRYLIRSINLEIKRSIRFDQVFSFIMLDVDNLKDYNDKNGHLSGSRALTDIAAILKSNCRDIDVVAKYGGDEFAILLPQTNLEGAIKLGERILKAINLFKFDRVNAGLLSCSLGIAVYPEDALGVEELIDNADAALYKAKAEGKNNIKCYRGLKYLEKA